MKIRFILKRPDSDTPTAIVMLIYLPKRIKYYPGISIHPKDFPNGHAKISHIANKLKRLSLALEKAHSAYVISERPFTEADVMNILDPLCKKESVSSDMYTKLEEVIAKLKDGHILTKSRLYSEGTIKRLKLAASVLQRFNPALKFEGISIDTYHQFLSWCAAQNYSINYTGSLINGIKMLLKLSYHAGLHRNDIYEHRGFKKLQEESTEVYLSDAELDKICALELTSRQAVVRDWFILGCHVGLRVSDLVRLDKDNLQGDYITIANEKTDVKVVIPVHKRVRAIIKKYKGFPPRVSDVEINREIKHIVRSAKIHERVLCTITKGGKRVDTFYQKWQMVSTHTCRRSFITNLRKSGIPDSIVMKLSGITSPATLKKYDRLNVNEAAEIAKGMGYFK